MFVDNSAYSTLINPQQEVVVFKKGIDENSSIFEEKYEIVLFYYNFAKITRA